MELGMMRRLLIYIFVLSLFGISSATAQDSDSRENELRTYFIKFMEGFNKNNIDNIDATHLGSFRGFGYRTKYPRIPGDVPPLQYDQYIKGYVQFVKNWLKTMKYYSSKIEVLHVAVDGDIGFVWGFYINDFQEIGKPPEKYKVRFSSTLRRTEDGSWIQLMEHRDIQNFDETGQYIPNYLKSDDSKP
jgi:hypothetical protein